MHGKSLAKLGHTYKYSFCIKSPQTRYKNRWTCLCISVKHLRFDLNNLFTLLRVLVEQVLTWSQQYVLHLGFNKIHLSSERPRGHLQRMGGHSVHRAVLVDRSGDWRTKCNKWAAAATWRDTSEVSTWGLRRRGIFWLTVTGPMFTACVHNQLGQVIEWWLWVHGQDFDVVHEEKGRIYQF